MQKYTSLFSCLFGSRLYGTSTPASDIDIKRVVLVDIDELLLGRGVKNSFKKTNTEKNVRNTVDDVDEEFIPVQVFARDFMEGQTYAIELAFAMDGDHAQQTFYTGNGDVYDHVKYTQFYQFTNELRSKFLTSNIKAMMGYVVNQASLYSFKGERLNVTREFLKLMQAILEDFKPEGVEFYSIADVWNLPEIGETLKLQAVALAEKYPKYFKLGEYDTDNNGRMMPCFFLLEKCLPFTNKIVYTIEVAKNVEKKYGTRAEQASETNVDWKATMHAVRIVDEGLKLLTEHKLDFPFDQPYVDRLLAIKRGELELNSIKEELAIKLDRLKDLEKSTALLTANELRSEFEVWLKSWMRKFYGI